MKYYINNFTYRRCRTTQNQAYALKHLSNKWMIPYQEEYLNINNIFGRNADTVLEIGFGMGEATEEIALSRKNENFIGIETFRPGIGSLLNKIEKSNIKNLRIIQHNAIEVIKNMIPRESLSGVHIYFPDPWPKVRHQKRRLIQESFISLISTRICKNGYIHCATDWEDYANQMLQVLSKEPLLTNLGIDCKNRSHVRPCTKFEKRGIELGHKISDLIFKRIF
ncbi:MAG: tRNA (guanosine(46)-N7)-methyltransferase TrmB [Bordetella sp.]|nr:MAG: tRNA (guanosine(46)-N7)-methyltransferase TrmB [Bordetella sp.]